MPTMFLRCGSDIRLVTMRSFMRCDTYGSLSFLVGKVVVVLSWCIRWWKNTEDLTNLGRKTMNWGCFLWRVEGKEENNVMMWFNKEPLKETRLRVEEYVQPTKRRDMKDLSERSIESMNMLKEDNKSKGMDSFYKFHLRYFNLNFSFIWI